MTQANPRCSVCSNLGECEKACQKFGSEDSDTQLSPASAQLLLVKDLLPTSSRELKVLKCPECNSYFLYSSDYEYLVNGSEDEQTLIRLSVEEAEKHLTLTEEQ